MNNDIVTLPCGLRGEGICCAFNCIVQNNKSNLKEKYNAIEICYHKLKKNKKYILNLILLQHLNIKK